MGSREEEGDWSQDDRRKQIEAFSKPILFRDITVADIPPDILQAIDSLRGKFFLPTNESAKAFNDFSFAEDAEGVEIYVGHVTNKYGKTPQECHCIMQVDGGKPVGYSWFSERQSEADGKRFSAVDDTETYADAQNEGYALKRLFEMNAYSLWKYKLTLMSDKGIMPNARRLWQRLVRYKFAHEVIEGSNQRYAFLPPSQ